jgi:hypothetical protein
MYEGLRKPETVRLEFLQRLKPLLKNSYRRVQRLKAPLILRRLRHR